MLNLTSNGDLRSVNIGMSQNSTWNGEKSGTFRFLPNALFGAGVKPVRTAFGVSVFCLFSSCKLLESGKGHMDLPRRSLLTFVRDGG